MEAIFKNNKLTITFDSNKEVCKFMDMFETYKSNELDFGEDFTKNPIFPLESIISKMEE